MGVVAMQDEEKNEGVVPGGGAPTEGGEGQAGGQTPPEGGEGQPGGEAEAGTETGGEEKPEGGSSE